MSGPLEEFEFVLMFTVFRQTRCNAWQKSAAVFIVYKCPCLFIYI